MQTAQRGYVSTGIGCLGTSSQRLQGGSCSMRSKPMGHRQVKQYDLGARQSTSVRILWGRRRCSGLCSSTDSDSASASVEVAPGSAFSGLIRQELLLFLVQLVSVAFVPACMSSVCLSSMTLYICQTLAPTTAMVCPFSCTCIIMNSLQKQRHTLQDFDRQLQRALNYENTEAADSIRSRRDALNQAVQKFQVLA